MGINGGVIYGLFALFVIFGALLGLKRGMWKSVIRIATVVLSCVIVVFLVQPITSAVLTADLSSYGWEIGGVMVTNLNETIINYISTISVVGQALNSSPTLLAVVSTIPAIIVNLILFVLLFFIVKGILYFVDIILNRVILKKDPERPKRRLWGMLIGAVQGVICFLFVFIPIAGSMNVLSETMDLVESMNSQTQAVAMQNIAVNESDSESLELSQDNVQITVTAKNVLKEYQDVFIIKMFNAIGYKGLTNAVYDKLTTMEISTNEKTTLRSEAKVVAKVYNSYEKLKYVDIAEFSAQNQRDADQLIDDAFSSPIVSGVATELVSELAKTWTATNPGEFIGMAKPEMNENLVETFDVLLLNLRNGSADNLKTDLKVIVGTLKVSADYNVTENISSEDTDTIVSVLGQDGCMEAIIGTLASGNATKQAIPKLIEFGLDYGYTAVGLDGVTTTINKSANDVNWETEKVILGDLFEGISATYLSTKQEGELINKLDVLGMAKVLNSVRASQLLSDSSQEISVRLLNSKLTAGIDVSTLVDYINNDTKYAELDFEVMLTTLKSSANIANNMQEIISGGDVSELDSEDVGTFLNGLTSNDATKDVLKDLASEENLKGSGVDQATAGAVNGLVETITDYDTTAPGAVQTPTSKEEQDNATKAVEKLIDASSNANSSTKSFIFSDNEETAKTKMNEFIDSLLSSEFMYASTINGGEQLGFKTGDESNLSTAEQGWLVETLQAKQASDSRCTELKCIEIANMFAVEYK